MAARLFHASCWVPAAALAGMMIYVQQFEGWGQWAAAPMLLLPVILSGVMTAWGLLRVLAERRAGRPHAGTWVAAAIAAIPLFWILYRLLLTSAAAAGQQVPDRAFRPPVPNPAYEVGSGPTVCVDAGHNNFHTLDGGFWAFGELARRDGYRTQSADGRISLATLVACDVFVIANAQLPIRSWAEYPYPTPGGFATDEIDLLHRWVGSGRALLLIADHMPLAGVATELAARFGVTFHDGFAMPDQQGEPTLFRMDDGTLRPHAIVRGRSAAESVTSVRSFTGQAFEAPGAEAILVLPPDYTQLMPERAWQFTDQTKRVPVGGWLQGAVTPVGRGRAAFFGEAAMFSAQVAGPNRQPMGMNAPMAEQNAQFVLNVLHWLTRALE